ncbi:hypothetical protein [Flavobacterium ajazii]|uniref:hypothetical protein n=1 Tax=Flavobacterium ajazii TaxID=2692318 RepID=UPI001FEB6901|nr:hypothetical protein [Flavobacterium ajazii]
MMTITTLKNRNTKFFLLFFFLLTFLVNAQIGIGTVTPNASSVLDVTSTTQGMLTPRMTTAQRTAIASPANGLIVYDTDLNAFEYYDSSVPVWRKIYGDAQGRLNYKLIKSTDVLSTVLAAELTAGGGAKYLLNSNTLYEINGTINLNFPIELNNAYIMGLDSSDDKLIKASGDLFVGTTGGSIRVLTLTAAGKVFDITGTGSIAANTQTQSLILRDCIVTGSGNVGKIENMAFAFLSIVQFLGNTNGIIYKDISKVLLSNVGWFGNNSGTYETLQGTFGLVEKVGGFTQVVGIPIGLDVSSNPVITGDAVMESVVYTGTLTTGKYVNGYSTGSYSGYNFNNKWSVRCPGIPTETDANATGEFSVNLTPGTGVAATVDNSGTAAKITVTTATTSIFRFSANNTARLTYTGFKKRIVQFAGSLSFVADSNGKTGIYIFYIAKNGVIVGQSKVYGYTGSISDTVAIPLSGSIDMNTNDYIEVFVDYYSGSAGKIKVTSLTLTAF